MTQGYLNISKITRCQYCGADFLKTTNNRKQCNSCKDKKVKKKSEYIKKINKIKSDPLLYDKYLQKNKLYYETNRHRIKITNYKSKIKNKEKRILKDIKTRAKKLGYDFNLDISDIVIPENCPVFGFKLCKGLENNANKQRSISVDRIDNLKGYVKGNIQIISFKANTMKNNATIEELQRFADWINKTYPH